MPEEPLSVDVALRCLQRQPDLYGSIVIFIVVVVVVANYDLGLKVSVCCFVDSIHRHPTIDRTSGNMLD